MLQDVGVMREREAAGFTEVAGAQSPEARAVASQVGQGMENSQAEEAQAKAWRVPSL